MHAAEGGVGGGPDFHPAGVRREDRAGDVVGADEVDRAAFDQRDGVPAVPHILPQQRAGGLIVFGDPAALRIKHRVDRDRGGGGEAPDRLTAEGVVGVLGLQEAVDSELGHPPGGVVGVAVGPPGAVVKRHIPRRVIGESPIAPRREGDAGQAAGERPPRPAGNGVLIQWVSGGCGVFQTSSFRLAFVFLPRRHSAR